GGQLHCAGGQKDPKRQRSARALCHYPMTSLIQARRFGRVAKSAALRVRLSSPDLRRPIVPLTAAIYQCNRAVLQRRIHEKRRERHGVSLVFACLCCLRRSTRLGAAGALAGGSFTANGTVLAQRASLAMRVVFPAIFAGDEAYELVEKRAARLWNQVFDAGPQ